MKKVHYYLTFFGQLLLKIGVINAMLLLLLPHAKKEQTTTF